MNWKSKGNCNGEPAQIFYLQDATKAKGICNGCPVQEECFVYAVRNNEKGVWGGYTEEERRKLRLMSYVQVVPLTEILRRNKRAREHLANEYQSYPVCNLGLKNRNLDVSGRVVALPPLVF